MYYMYYIIFAIFIYGIFVVIGITITMTKKRKIDRYLIRLATIPIYLMVAIIPFLFINNLFKNGFLIFAIVTVVGYVVIRLGINIYNKMKVKLAKGKEIYVRDIEVEYSPAVLSYLQNQKIEKKKDLIACILNLCAKGFLEIEKKEKNYYKLKPLKTNNNEILKKDEEYLYNKICKKEKIDINTWIEYVKEEFENYKFIQENKIHLSTIFLIIYFLNFIALMIYLEIIGKDGVRYEIFQAMCIPFFVAMELAILEPFMKVILSFLRKGEYLDGIYTIKGAKEMKKWDKYKKFLEDYTLVQDKPLDSITILEKHLSYAITLNVNKSYTKSFVQQLEEEHEINLECVDKILQEINEKIY